MLAMPRIFVYGTDGKGVGLALKMLLQNISTGCMNT